MKIYLFIGPQRSSTTSLYQSLQKFNSVSLVDEKENNYWQNAGANFKDYKTKFFEGNCLYGIDICPQYFSDTNTLAQIAKEQNKFHKIIFLHRNPLDRARSFLRLQYAYGRDVGQLIDDNSFTLNFKCHINLRHCLDIFQEDKFRIVYVDSLESFIANEFNIPEFRLCHVHKNFGSPRYKKFNEKLLPALLKFLRQHLKLNRLVDWVKENKLIRFILFKQKWGSNENEINDIIARFHRDIVEETCVIESCLLGGKVFKNR